jgi:hypothetical protein
VVVVACTKGEHRAAREAYNEGVALLKSGDFEAAEKKLLESRADAGVDPELRFRAAYDLGVAYAAHADKAKAGQDADLAKALELEQQAVSWFFDAQRLRKDDADTKTNLAIARARAAAISDELRKGENKLEARLDAVIGSQRKLLDEARAAWASIKEGGGKDPLAQQGALVHLADEERGIVAEAGVIGDLAGDEIDAIGKKADDKRSDEEKVRVIQLKNLDVYLGEARSRIAEARGKLQALAAEDGVGRAEAALVALKRAREQLLDPITVLRELAREEMQLAQETQASGQKDMPQWLAPGAVASRQGAVRERTEEIHARLEAGAQSEGKDDKEKKLLERVKIATPLVADASTAMEHARGALADGKLDDAQKSERDALIALAKAIEQFADLKQTIELADETQHMMVQLLGPEAAKQLAAKERMDQTKDALAQNLARMPRIAELIADAAAQKVDDKDKDKAEALKEQMAQAESLRADAAKALAKVEELMKAGKDPTAPAKEAQDKLDELRKLFFSVIEHLQQLIRDQGETRDQTSAANGLDDFSRAPKLPGLAQREGEHTEMAKAITEALAKQADEAQKQKQPQGQPQAQGGPDPKALSGAADEVRLAQGEMTDAGLSIGKAKDATNATISLDPAVKSEAKAIEHLENALKLLQPPPQKQQDKQQKKQDQQQQQQQDQQKKQDQQQQQQQGGAGQRARDEDAKRQRERQQKQQKSDPVEQDW